GGRALGYLDVSATLNPDSRQVFLNVLNRSEKMDIESTVDAGGTAPSAVEVWELNHPDLKTTHTFGSDKAVRPTGRKFDVKAAGNGFSYSFPKRSLTILKWKGR